MSMKSLWAPWRGELLDNKALKEDRDSCVFCRVFRETDDRTNLILERTEYVALVLNKYPYNNGHLMVCHWNIPDALKHCPQPSNLK